MNRPSLVLSFFQIALLFLTVQVEAITTLSSSVTDNLDGTFTYDYSIDNTDGDYEVAELVLEFDFLSVDAGFLYDSSDFGADITLPEGWASYEEIPLSGVSALDIFSEDFDYDVLIGETLSGFSFTSVFSPGDVSYSLFSYDYDDAGSGTVVGPVSASQVPDSSSTFFILAAVCVTLLPLRAKYSR